MAIDTSVWALDLGAMITDLPATMTAAFLTGSTQVSVAELGFEQSLIITGNENVKAFACTFPVSAASSTPTVHTRVSITRPGEAGPINYQIKKVASPADGIAWTLLLIQDVRQP
jgi:hypothetical protein